jgi:hypothetical protein
LVFKEYIRCDIIKKSARKEFEIAKDEKDPFMVMRMIMTSREAM